MSAVGLEALDHTVQLTHAWINDLDRRLGWQNKPRAYRLLKAVLHSLRDWLPINELADFAAQLPQLLRGAYYEQWRPSAARIKHRSKADFIARIEDPSRLIPSRIQRKLSSRCLNCCRKKSRRVRSRTCGTHCRRICEIYGRKPASPHRAADAFSLTYIVDLITPIAEPQTRFAELVASKEG